MKRAAPKGTVAWRVSCNAFREVLYRELRNYEDGKYAAMSGVASGQLSIAATKVQDNVLAVIDELFRPKRTRP